MAKKSLSQRFNESPGYYTPQHSSLLMEERRINDTITRLVTHMAQRMGCLPSSSLIRSYQQKVFKGELTLSQVRKEIQKF